MKIAAVKHSEAIVKPNANAQALTVNSKEAGTIRMLIALDNETRDNTIEDSSAQDIAAMLSEFGY